MTDFQHREGSTGSAGVASKSEANLDRRERLRRLAMETIDLSRDPYFMKNHLGSYECRLCLTLHSNEGSYLAHTQGKKHQSNLGRRAAREAALLGTTPIGTEKESIKIQPKKSFVAIGRPRVQTTRIIDPDTGHHGFLIQIEYPQAKAIPMHRIMSAFEQKSEAPDPNRQYIVVAAEPYETIGFRVVGGKIDVGSRWFLTHWNPTVGKFTVQVFGEKR